jgi:hypothetical protein
MSKYDEFDFESRIEDRQSASGKFWRFLRYLSTRKMECWGFFVAGYIIATIF